MVTRSGALTHAHDLPHNDNQPSFFRGLVMGIKGFASEPFFRHPAIAAVVVAVLMVTGCGGSSDTDSSNGDPSPDSNPAIVEAAVCPGTGSAIENPVVYLAQVTPQTSPQLFVADSANPSLGSTVLNPSLSGEQSIRQFVLAPNNRCVFMMFSPSTVKPVPTG